MRTIPFKIVLFLLATIALAGQTLAVTEQCATNSPQTTSHFITVDAADVSKTQAMGFNVASVESPGELAKLPAGVKGVAMDLMGCSGVTSDFKSKVAAYRGAGNLSAVYVVDEPTPESCDPATINAQTDYINVNLPGVDTMVVLHEWAKPYSAYARNATLIGADPYPCETDFCDYGYITRVVNDMIADGVDRSRIVPTYQAYGKTGESKLGLNDPAAEHAAWASVVPNPKMDFTWTAKQYDANEGTLLNSEKLKTFYRNRNAGACTTAAPAAAGPSIDHRYLDRSPRTSSAKVSAIRPLSVQLPAYRPAIEAAECHESTQAERIAFCEADGQSEGCNLDFTPKCTTEQAELQPATAEEIAAAAAPPVSGKLIFGDEFDCAAGAKPGSQWTFFNAWGSGKWRDALYSDQYAKCDGNGNLLISSEIANGVLKTSYLQGFDKNIGPGTHMEARINMSDCTTPGNSPWCAFWSYNFKNPNAGTEIDIAEIAPANAWSSQRYTAGNHIGKGGGDASHNAWLDRDPTGWHTYGAEWRDKEIVYSFDGKEVFTSSRTLDGGDGQAIVLSIESAGGDKSPWAPGTVLKEAPSMLVDYVRVYED